MLNFVTSKKINSLLNSPKKIKTVCTTTSTNTVLKNKYLSGEDLQVLIAESQSSGRGRLNRTFYSPKFSGIYMSYRVNGNFEIDSIGKITTFVAVCVAKAIEELYNTKIDIKWVNDLFLNGKKVCGILCESVFIDNKVKGVIIGIGINVYNKKFPTSLQDIATNLQKETNLKVDRNKIISTIINNLENIESKLTCQEYFNEYKSRLFILGKEIKVITSEEEYLAKCTGLSTSGALIVEKDGKSIELICGDVSVKV